MRDVPGLVLSLTIWAYWLCVGVLAVRMRRRTHKLAGIVPSQPLEQMMWLVWVPLVTAWAVLPYLAATRTGLPWGLPESVRQPPYSLLRWTAAGVGVACLLLSIACWRRMGKNWSMAVVPGQSTELVTGGLYSRIRHPIYALSMLLMLCTMVVAPTPAVVAMAAVHIALMIVKALNEERFLSEVHGARYNDYCQRTGRFVPRRGTHATGRFNLFQRMMLRWRELHPYNPVHVVRVPGPLDAARLRACIGARLEAAGLTGLVRDGGQWRFRYAGGPAVVDLGVTRAKNDTADELARLIEREFNRPFAASADAQPFRFQAIDAGDSFHLALAYDHFIASGDSVARLLTAIACAYAGAGGSAPAPELYPPTYRALFIRHPMAALRSLLALPRLVASARHAYRPPCSDADDLSNAFISFQLDRGQTQALHAIRKAWGATLNDVLLAILLQALSPTATGRRAARRRNELAIASILNMRSDFDGNATQAVSPFLAAFRVGHPMPDGVGLKTLVQQVHAETQRARQRHLYLQSILALALSAMLWPLLTPRRRAGFYLKHYPTSAGLTTLNVDALWAGVDDSVVARLDYLRAVPTGPLCPMVVAVTVVHDRLHVGVAFRTAVYLPAAVADITAEFRRCIERLSKEPL
jgi:protein-S-isoprenylcysteine O-methyltransferase Ste14